MHQGLQRDINNVARDLSSLRRDLDEKTNSLHTDIAILGQDVQRDVTLLQRNVTSLQLDVMSLQLDVTSLQQDVKSLPQDLTLKQAMNHNLDSLSKQFVGVLKDFKKLAETIYSNFDSWAKTAHSRVIDKVLEIQRPRLKAIEDKLHKIASCAW